MTEFPQFRKYVGVDTWYKITSNNFFIEVKRVGEQYVTSEIEAVQYPEKLRIQDMLECLENRWEVIDETAFDALT